MKTTTAKRIEWSPEVNELGKVIAYTASGDGYEARIIPAVTGWDGVVHLGRRATLRPRRALVSSEGCKAWARRVVNEYS